MTSLSDVKGLVQRSRVEGVRGPMTFDPIRLDDMAVADGRYLMTTIEWRQPGVCGHPCEAAGGT